MSATTSLLWYSAQREFMTRELSTDTLMGAVADDADWRSATRPRSSLAYTLSNVSVIGWRLPELEPRATTANSFCSSGLYRPPRNTVSTNDTFVSVSGDRIVYVLSTDTNSHRSTRTDVMYRLLYDVVVASTCLVAFENCTPRTVVTTARSLLAEKLHASVRPLKSTWKLAGRPLRPAWTVTPAGHDTCVLPSPLYTPTNKLSVSPADIWRAAKSSVCHAAPNDEPSLPFAPNGDT
mmetsp:Transcript_26227/g.63750  ORF Transcript_26227/g.63750 Transcript_26227/m.63750 type:complete len:236 (+) Transcript_26227:814-1521(+)